MLIFRDMLVESNHTIGEIQENFNAAYPFLKIEFLEKLHIRSRFSIKPLKIGKQDKLKQLTGYECGEEININCTRTVLELERDFFEKLGTFVRIYRRSGNVWVETSLTNNWTLEQQNAEGKELSLPNQTNISG